MVQTMTLKELRPELPRVVERIDKKLDRYVITRHGKPVVMMMGIDDYEALIETLDILNDPVTMKRLKLAEADIKKGRTVSWKKVKRSLGLAA
ncbi:MAG: type II toxin-antitoxin system Phd/YefM family antitoxin [Nanoarchaeota archaeon]